VFEAANRLGVQACAVVDSDLRSITPDWVKYLLYPVLEKVRDTFLFVAPCSCGIFIVKGKTVFIG